LAGKADIKLGYTCNNHCVHCVITDQRDHARRIRGDSDRGTAEVLRELADAHHRGYSDVVVTGGEPTIRKDLPVILERARDLGFRLHIQTNGRMLAHRPLAERLAPIRAVYAVALHGPTAQIHDRVTETPGSFEQTVAGIRNLRALEQRVIGKMVLSRYNADAQTATIGLLLSLGVDTINVAFPHALGTARERFDEVVPRYRDILPDAHRALTRYGQQATLFYEAVPLCLMGGFEHHVAEYACKPLQGRAVHKQLDMETRDWRRARSEQKCKFEGCARCRFDPVCEGPWREYPEHFGDEEFVPVPPVIR